MKTVTVSVHTNGGTTKNPLPETVDLPAIPVEGTDGTLVVHRRLDGCHYGGEYAVSHAACGKDQIFGPLPEPRRRGDPRPISSTTTCGRRSEAWRKPGRIALR